MKNVMLLAIAAVLFLSACSTQPTFKLNGTIEGAESKTLVLSVYDKNGVNVLDTLTITDGVVNYETTLREPVLLIIGESGKRASASLFADNSTYTIKADAAMLVDATITGGDLFKKYTVVDDAENALRNISGDLREQYSKAREAGDTAKLSVIATQYDAEVAKVDKVKMDVVKANADSPLAAYLVYELFRHKGLDEMKQGQAMLHKSLASSTYYMALNERIEKLETVAVGKMAPDFILNDVDGNPLALSSLTGKVLLIDFWASWCGPCRAENPHVVEIYNAYKDKGFDILGVSLDKKKEDWLKAIEKDQLTWNHVSDLQGWKNSAAQLYAVNSIPHTVLLDKDGKIVAKNLRGDELKAKVAELLK